jgi:RsiW-degrading membrane proteinase PrsW (M82 family)
MISVALGFTCCENLVYIFIYNGSSLEMEIWVLIVRSFFPVHALAAAIQSVGVCERDLESSRTLKLGHIIWPAVLFHGGYDFVLLWIDFMADRKAGKDDAKDALESSGLVLLLAVILSVLAVLIAFVYYLKASRKQRVRLIAMDRQEAATRSSLI